MNPRHSGRRYSDLLYKMIAIVGMACAVGMAALITAWVAGDAKAVTISICGGGTDANTCAAEEVCPGGFVVDLDGSGEDCGPPPVPGEVLSTVLVCDATACVAAPVATGAGGYTPSGWSGPTTPPGEAGVASSSVGHAWYITAPLAGPFASWSGAREEARRRWLIANPTKENVVYTGSGCGPAVDAGGTFWWRSAPKSTGILGVCATSAVDITYAGTTCASGQRRYHNGSGYDACAAGWDCPEGYVKPYGSNTCAAIAGGVGTPRPSDGKCNVTRTLNEYTGDPMDPDCTLGAAGGAPVITGTSVTASKATGDQLKTGSVVVGTDGAVTIKNQVADSGASVTSSTTVKSTTSSSAPTVAGSIQQSVAGVGSLQGTAPVTAPAGEGGEFPELPTDYNREPTQQLILDELTAAPDDLDAATDALDAATDERIAAFAGATGAHGIALSFSPILPTPSCSFPSFTVAGHTLDMSAWCPRIEILRQLIALALYIATAFALYDIFTRTSGA